MSRAYRIKVKESVTKVIRAEDHVTSRLEVLEILPREQMGELLAQQLQKLGFQRDGDELTQTVNGVVVTINTKTSTIDVRVETETDVTLSDTKSGYAYDDVGPGTEKAKELLSAQLKEKLHSDVESRQDQLQQSVTDALEAELLDIRQTVDRAVNAATAEALKQKAAQMGQIKELSEDAESGSLKIVIEV